MNIRNKSLGQTWLWQYWDAVQRGEIIAGLELRAELDRLLADLDDDRYF